MQEPHQSPRTHTPLPHAHSHEIWDGAPFETTSWIAIQAVARKYDLPLRARDIVLQELHEAEQELALRGNGIAVLEPRDRSSWVVTARLTAAGRAIYRLAKATGIQDNDRCEAKTTPAKRFPVIGAKASVNALKSMGFSTGATAHSHSTASQTVCNSAAAGSQDTSEMGHTKLSSHVQPSSAQASLPSEMYSLSRTECLRGGDVLGAILSHLRSSDHSCCHPLDVPSQGLGISPDLTPSLDCQRPSGVRNDQPTEKPEASICLADGGQVTSPDHQAPLPRSDDSWRTKQVGSLERFSSPSSPEVSVDRHSDHKSSVPTSAPTITALIAVLTSVIDNRLMTNFFLTFRIFMTTRQLLESLIERFSWATTPSSYDSSPRRIVLVRTYAILKYWLQQFFELDYLCDRPLRERLTTWLNEAGTGARNMDSTVETSVINSLKNVVRDLKHMYMRTGVSALLQDEHSRSAPTDSQCEVLTVVQDMAPLTAGVETHSPLNISDSQTERNSNDLRRLQTLAKPSGLVPIETTILAQPRQSSYTSLDRTGSEDVAVPASMPTLSYDPLTRAISSTVEALARIKRSMGNGGIKLHSARDTLAEYHCRRSDLLFVRDGIKNLVRFCEQGREGGAYRDRECSFAIGHLNDHTPSLGTSSTVSSDTLDSVLDFAAPRTNPYWESKRGQQALIVDRSSGNSSLRDSYDGVCSGQSCRVQRARACSLDGANLDRLPLNATARERHYSHSNGLSRSPSRYASPGGPSQSSCPERQDVLRATRHAISNRTLRPAAHRAADAQLPERDRLTPMSLPSRTSSPSAAETVSQVSYATLLHLISPSAERPNIVQIDDIDLSSDEDDGVVRQALRRLPGARDLRTANRSGNAQASSTQATSSCNAKMLDTTRATISASSSLKAHSDRMTDSCRESDLSSSEQVEMMDPDDALAGYELVQGFRIEDFASDEDEAPGGVEEALRRLEGFIDEGKRLARAQRVEALWANSRSRQAAELASPEADTEQAVVSEAGHCLPSAHRLPRRNRSSQPCAEADSGMATSFLADPFSFATAPGEMAACGYDTDPANVAEARQTPQPASEPSSGLLPGIEILKLKPEARPPPTGIPGPQPLPPVHRCFLLDHRSEAIAQHFTLIERELFCAIDWTDLVTNRWRERSQPYEVVDWEAYYKAQCQARQRAEAAGERHPRTDVETIVARFNLTCNWVASQVVLTRRAEERVAVISKLIRVAFKCYQQCNFVTLVEICLGLQSPWVEHLHKTWAKMGSWEMRVFRDLKALTSPRDDFRHLRAAMHELITDGNLEELITCSGPSKAPRGAPVRHAGRNEVLIAATSRCVPFFGLFISDLDRWHRLPSFIGSKASLSSAHAFAQAEHVQRSQINPLERANLPAYVSNVPSQSSVNMLKVEQLGSTVKTILALQQKAASYAYEADGTLYNKCLRLRCLDGHQMTQLSPPDD